jgi:regulator of sigma E protease
LSLLPFISYVKMLGEEPGSDAGTDPGSFAAQPFGRKAAIVAAGSVSNILLALVLFVAVFRIGIPFATARIGYVEYGSPAYYAGIMAGDRVVEIAGRRQIDFQDLFVKTALADPGVPILLVVERDGVEIPVTAYPEYVGSEGTGYIGVGQSPTLEVENLRGAGGTESPAKKAGVEPGWELVAFNDVPLASWAGFQTVAAANGLKPYTLRLRKDGVERTANITPERNAAATLGILQFQSTQIESVTADSAAALIGLQPGDIISAVGDRRCNTLSEVREAITEQLRALPPIRVIRDGRLLELAWTRTPSSGFDFISALRAPDTSQIAWVEPGSPAAVMGLAAGDAVVAIDGKETVGFTAIRKALGETKGETITVSWRRGDRQLEGTFQPVFAGIEPSIEVAERKLGFAASCRVGVRKAWDFASQVYILIRKAFSGHAQVAKSLRGPVAIAQVSYRIAQQGFVQLLFFLAVIGINLGVMNLLPLPILDGGALVVFFIEKVKGSPLGPRTQMVYQWAGIMIIAALIIFVTWQDIYRLIHGG